MRCRIFDEAWLSEKPGALIVADFVHIQYFSVLHAIEVSLLSQCAKKRWNLFRLPISLRLFA